MKSAHGPVGVGGGKSGVYRGKKNLRQSAGYRKENGSYKKSRIFVLGENKGRCRKYPKSCGGKYGHKSDRLLNIKFMGEKGEDKVDYKLGRKVYEDQKAEKRIGDPVKASESQKKQGS